jgi:hypothetical protein
MIAVWILIFFVVPAIVLVFILAMCKSAARGDKEIERARSVERRTSSNSDEWTESKKRAPNFSRH